MDRIVLLKLIDTLANPAGRSQTAALLTERLAAEPLDAEVTLGLPADEAAERSWDLALSFSLSSDAALEPEGPLLRGLEERVLVKKAWSFRRFTPRA